MLPWKDGPHRLHCRPVPVSRWALEAVAVSRWLFQGVLSISFGCIHFIFSQSSFLNANRRRGVNTLDPDRKHLSYVWTVLAFPDQNHSVRRVVRVWQPSRLPQIPHFPHTDCDPVSTWRHFFSGIEKPPSIYILKPMKHIKELKHGWLKKIYIYMALCVVLSVSPLGKEFKKLLVLVSVYYF